MKQSTRYTLVLLSFVWLFANHSPSLPVGFVIAAALLLRKPTYYQSTYTRWDTVRAEKVPLAFCVAAMLLGFFFIHIGPALQSQYDGTSFGCLYSLR
jgi:hypothetical protein